MTYYSVPYFDRYSSYQYKIQQLTKSLTNSNNTRRCYYYRFTNNTKLVLQSLGYQSKSKTTVAFGYISGHVQGRRRCCLCPTHPR
ncbi:unnamed protein product, partial [Adineta ricciae]